MDDAPQTKPSDTRHSLSISALLLWSVAAILIYLLSSGPVLMFAKTRSAKAHILNHYYAPLEWLYSRMPMKTTFGLYYHLWIPEDFDSHGNLISAPPPI